MNASNYSELELREPSAVQESSDWVDLSRGRHGVRYYTHGYPVAKRIDLRTIAFCDYHSENRTMAGRKRDPGGYSLGSGASATVAGKVSSLMAAKRLTQQALAQALGRQQGWISSLLSGRRRFQRWQVLALAKTLGVTERDLLPPEAPPPGSAESLPPAPQAAPLDRAPSPPVSVPGASVPSVRRLPPGLEGFLGRHGEDVTPAERSLLERSGFSTDKRVRFDDDFWWAILKVIRKHYLGPGGGGEAGGGASPAGGAH
jgi:transcriptional regulator with XRE-family HTH domain